MPAPFPWPDGRRAALSLTYDDGLPVHRQLVAPLLERQGLRATFYVNLLASGSTRRREITDIVRDPEPWRALAHAGHELGNHTAFHPCRIADPAQFDWLDPAFDLRGYTPSRWWAESRLANFTLQLLDGQTQRTFGNTCCDTTLGQGETEQSLEPLIEELFLAGRGPLNGRIVEPWTANLPALGHCSGDGGSCAALQQLVEQALAQGGWLILMIHGVGSGPGSHRLHLDAAEHEQFINWLATQTRQLWTAPMRAVAQQVRAGRA